MSALVCGIWIRCQVLWCSSTVSVALQRFLLRQLLLQGTLTTACLAGNLPVSSRVVIWPAFCTASSSSRLSSARSNGAEFMRSLA